MAMASARSAGARSRAADAALSSVWPLRSTESSIRSAACRAPNPSTLGMKPFNSHLRRDETPEASRSARASEPFAPHPGTGADNRTTTARRRRDEARSDALRRLGEEGYRGRFLERLRLGRPREQSAEHF